MMELLDLCSVERWLELEDRIRSMSGLNASVYNIDGIRLNPTESWPNRLCPEVKATSKGQSFICATAHMNLANQARTERTSLIEECDAGLVKLVVPIFVDDLFLGAVGGCGLLLDEGEVDTFAVYKITEMEEEKVESLSQGIPRISSSRASEVIHFIEGQIEAIVSDYRSKSGR